jgi:hypothetical protein
LSPKPSECPPLIWEQIVVASSAFEESKDAASKQVQTLLDDAGKSVLRRVPIRGDIHTRIVLVRLVFIGSGLVSKEAKDSTKCPFKLIKGTRPIAGGGQVTFTMGEEWNRDEFGSQAEEWKKVVGRLEGGGEVVESHVAWSTAVVPTWHFTKVGTGIVER